MPRHSRFSCAIAVAIFCAVAAHAQEAAAPQAPPPPFPAAAQESLTAWAQDFWKPLLNLLTSFFAAPEPPASQIANAAAVLAQALPPCSVAPLDPITDPAALQLEAGIGPDGVVDTADMIPGAARALDRFELRIASIGGSMILKSAYRPAAYQRHLQNVWYKWMDELRDNHDPSCQDLRAQVQQEFLRHQLIETQHPVAVSDHTRGIAFDATVALPANARIGRRRITLDRLARLAGLTRPAIASDPVHFKWLGGSRIARKPLNG